MHDMMRLTMAVWWILALVWLVTSQAVAEPASDQPARRITAKGYGSTDEVAKKDALKAAAEKLQEELHRQQFDHWHPSEKFIKERLLVDTGQSGDKFKGLNAWIYEVAIPDAETLQYLDQRARRQERAEARLSLALHTVAGIALVLVVLIGYLRADEWTRSRYTAWLRLAGVSALVAIVAGWMWLR